MSRIATELEAAATRWDAGGRTSSDLWTEWDFLVAYCWIYVPTGRREGVSALAEEFVRASRAHVGRGYDALLAQRSACDACGESYKVENLAVCVECRRLHCPRCGNGSGGGGRRCRCGGELVG